MLTTQFKSNPQILDLENTTKMVLKCKCNFYSISEENQASDPNYLKLKLKLNEAYSPSKQKK